MRYFYYPRGRIGIGPLQRKNKQLTTLRFVNRWQVLIEKKENKTAEESGGESLLDLAVAFFVQINPNKEIFFRLSSASVYLWASSILA